MNRSMVGIRVLTALVLFTFLAKANVWASTQAHMVLAVGYRALLVFAPLVLRLGFARALQGSLALSLVGAVLSVVSIHWSSMFFLATGMAISGYLAKWLSSQSDQGAADNKVSLNLGSLASGALLWSVQSRPLLMVLLVVALGASLFLSFRIPIASAEPVSTPQGQHDQGAESAHAITLLGWALVGIATGIKLTGIFTILPQYYLSKLEVLPNWFGALIMLNSLGVVFAQHRVMRWLAKRPERDTFLVSLSAMVLLALPGVLFVDIPAMAVLWVGLLTLGECALSRYDRLAQSTGSLWIKEFMVGAGSWLTVFLTRHHHHWISASGIAGSLALVAGVLLLTSSRFAPKRVNAKSGTSNAELASKTRSPPEGAAPLDPLTPSLQ
ncbi:MAG: hypothetical protein RJB38_1652 [Pseudomonadota bacterium]|jgi:hypothetical protein